MKNQYFYLDIFYNWRIQIVANLTFKANLLPNSNLGYSLGSSTAQWNVYGTFKGNADTATNADKVDNYHASDLLRKDGGTWNPNANITLTATANDQEWSFDIYKNGYTGAYWHVWDNNKGSLLRVNADDGKIHGQYGFVGNLEGNASSATKATKDGSGNVITSKYVTLDTDQTLTAVKYLANGSSVVSNGIDCPLCYFRAAAADSYQPLGMIFTYWKTVNSKRVCTSMYFRHYSYNSSGNSTSNCEQYYLPEVSQDSSGGSYAILTAKSAVTIAQGGTGATTAAGARSNLGCAASSHTHSYLPLSGGTMTGKITSTCTNSSSWIGGVRSGAFVCTTNNTNNSYQGWIAGKTMQGSWSIGCLTGTNNNEELWFIYGSDSNYNSNTNTTGRVHFGTGGQVYGAVWNDYAEYRETKEKIEPGRCIVETGKGNLILSSSRLQEGCEIVSDTFGFAIGESKKCKTPTATSGRVLAYLLEDNNKARPGQPVCSGPNGTVSLMTNEEARNWPWCIIGTISEIPDYDIWHAGDDNKNSDNPIQVNGRVWIRIR